MLIIIFKVLRLSLFLS